MFILKQLVIITPMSENKREEAIRILPTMSEEGKINLNDACWQILKKDASIKTTLMLQQSFYKQHPEQIIPKIMGDYIVKLMLESEVLNDENYKELEERLFYEISFSTKEEKQTVKPLKNKWYQFWK